MSRKLATFAAAGVLAAGAASASAGVLLDDKISYANQAAFEAAWPMIATTTDTTKQSAQLSTVQSASAPSSIFVPVSTTATTASTEYRNRRSFAESNTLSTAGNLGIGDKLIWSYDFYDAQTGLTSTAGNPQRNFVSLQDSTAPSATNQLISLGLNNNLLAAQDGGNYYMARILGYTPTYTPELSGTANPAPVSGSFFKLNGSGAPLRSTGWHNLEVILSTDDALSTDYGFYVDGILSKTILNVGTATSIRSYDNIATGSGLTNGISVYFDNMYVELAPAPVPEPASLSLLGLGALGLVARRRRD
jgi:hypothetical protein